MGWDFRARRYYKQGEARSGKRHGMTRLGRWIRAILLELDVAGVPDNVQIERLFPGYWQRSAGAWLWHAYNGENPHSVWAVGSCETATEIVAAYRSTTHRVVLLSLTGGLELMSEKKRDD